MLIPLKAAIDEHIEVLEQYLISDTNSEPLAYMFERILRKFHKKEHFKNALLLWAARRNKNIPDGEWKTLFEALHEILTFKLGADFSIKIIASLKIHYKIK